MNKIHRFLISAALCAVAAPLAAEEVAVINAASPVASLSGDQLKELFLGKKSSWEDGGKVIVVIAKAGPSQDALMSLLGKSSSQFQTGWKKLVFTGKAAMPEQVDNDEAVIDLVAKTPGAIGYVDKAKLKDGVKALTVQ